jgi:hypothetical protein
MKVSAGINAIVLGKTGRIKDHWTADYDRYIMSMYIGVERFYGKPQDS